MRTTREQTGRKNKCSTVAQPQKRKGCPFHPILPKKQTIFPKELLALVSHLLKHSIIHSKSVKELSNVLVLAFDIVLNNYGCVTSTAFMLSLQNHTEAQTQYGFLRVHRKITLPRGGVHPPPPLLWHSGGFGLECYLLIYSLPRPCPGKSAGVAEVKSISHIQTMNQHKVQIHLLVMVFVRAMPRFCRLLARLWRNLILRPS